MIASVRVVPGRVPFTWRKLVIAGAAAVFAPAVTAAFMVESVPAAAQQPQSINWSIESQRTGNHLQLTIDSRWSANSRSTWSNDGSLAELQGLTAIQLAGGSQAVRFALVKEAGRLDCSGSAGGGRGSGVCNFTPDPGFTTFLKARGIARPSPHQSYSLTMSGVGRDLIDALDKNGFARPNIEQLTAMGIHGVKPEFVRQMAAIGPEFRNVTADDLVSMAIHGVRPELAQTFVQLEGGKLRSDDVVSMAIHGVSADYIRQLAALGYRGLSADDLVSMAIHGVTPTYVQELHRSGMTRLSADQLVRLRLSGFDPR